MLGTFNLGFGAQLKLHAVHGDQYVRFSSRDHQSAAGDTDHHDWRWGEGFTFEHQLASNLGPLFDPSSPFLYSVASSLDLFNLWTLILTGIGYSCVSKVKRGTCMAVVFGWWAVVVLVGAGFAALFA